MTETTPARRSLFKAAAAGAVGAAVLAAPQVSRAQTMTLRFQSTWPQRDIFHEFAGDYVNRCNTLGGGRLRIELLPAGAVVGAFQMIDAVSTGTLDGGHGVSAYWFGRNRAFSLFGTGPAWFLDANSYLAWFYYGGGEALYNELLTQVVRMNVVGFQTGPMPTQPLGWFRTPITSVEQLRGMRYRTVGLATDLFNRMGAAVTALPAGEIVPALERGVIDGAEFNNPSSDRILGFPDVAKNYMLQSYHQNGETFEALWNRTRFDALPEELRAVLRHAAEAASADMSWKQQLRYPNDLDAMVANNAVVVHTTPRPILDAQLRAWDAMLVDLERDPFFKRITDSQREWCRRVSAFYLRNNASAAVAFNHFFARR